MLRLQVRIAAAGSLASLAQSSNINKMKVSSEQRFARSITQQMQSAEVQLKLANRLEGLSARLGEAPLLSLLEAALGKPGMRSLSRLSQQARRLPSSIHVVARESLQHSPAEPLPKMAAANLACHEIAHRSTCWELSAQFVQVKVPLNNQTDVPELVRALRACAADEQLAVARLISTLSSESFSQSQLLEAGDAFLRPFARLLRCRSCFWPRILLSR